MVGARLDQAELLGVRHQRRHAVIAQAAGVEAGRNEGRAERVHLDQRRQMRGVAEIVGVFAARQRRAGGRLDRDDAALAAAAQLQPEKRKRKPGEIRAAAGAGDHHVGIVARHLALLDRFLPDDGLVQQHVIEHRAERIFHRRVLGRHFHRLGNRDAERAGAVGMFLQDGAAASRSRSTARRCSARHRFPSARGGRASDRTTRAPGTPARRCRTARRRRRARSPIARRRFPSTAA